MVIVLSLLKNKFLEIFLKQQSRANIDTNDVGDVTDVCYFSLPYFGPQSDKLKKEILSSFDKYFVNLNVKIVFTNKFTIGSFFLISKINFLSVCSLL